MIILSTREKQNSINSIQMKQTYERLKFESVYNEMKSLIRKIMRSSLGKTETKEFRIHLH